MYQVGNNTIFKPTCQSYPKYRKHLKLEIHYLKLYFKNLHQVCPVYQNNTNNSMKNQFRWSGLLSDNFWEYNY